MAISLNKKNNYLIYRVFSIQKVFYISYINDSSIGISIIGHSIGIKGEDRNYESYSIIPTLSHLPNNRIKFQDGDYVGLKLLILVVD